MTKESRGAQEQSVVPTKVGTRGSAAQHKHNSTTTNLPFGRNLQPDSRGGSGKRPGQRKKDLEKAARFTAKCAPAGRSAAAERAPERAAERAGPRATAAAGGGLAAGRSPAAVRSPAAAEGAAAGRAHPAAAAAGAAGAAADRSEAEVTEEVLK